MAPVPVWISLSLIFSEVIELNRDLRAAIDPTTSVFKIIFSSFCCSACMVEYKFSTVIRSFFDNKFVRLS